MRIDILTLFPKMFDGVLGESMLKRARHKGIIDVRIHDLRDWTADRHRTADDYPYGGGPGMVMKVEPVFRALNDLRALRGGARSGRRNRGTKVVLLTPQGRRFDQRTARDWSGERRIVVVCGHYEGVDERVRSLVTDEISIGDYILTCGEIPAMVLIDCVARLLPGVVGDPASLVHESFEKGLLEYPQYTKPRSFRGMDVPKVLLGGDHRAIERWRFEQSLQRTGKRRPDLLAGNAAGKRKVS